MRLFQNMLASLMENSARFGKLGRKYVGPPSSNPDEAIDAVMSATGEVSSLVYAENLLTVLEDLSDSELATIFLGILSRQDIDAAALATAATTYQKTPNSEHLDAISKLAEPKWLELFRRLNATKNGTVRLVHLRKRLLTLIADHPSLRRIDSGLVALMRHWFNPGFLVLQPIDWATPANILEKIIAYEAVHKIRSWDELRARLAPDDRRCFAFFHPAMPDEPLIFVEVALTNEIPDNIDRLLDLDRTASTAEAAHTAVFYSISNCQAGLAGISFGNFLIKRVAQELKQEAENLQQFVTLSPVPGLMQWMTRFEPSLAASLTDNIGGETETKSDVEGFLGQESMADKIQRAAIRYLTESNRDDGMPNDPVSRFHIGNGATLEQLNHAADLSAKGIAQSAGLMVNYKYDLEIVEQNHEEFVKSRQVPVSASIKTLRKALFD